MVDLTRFVVEKIPEEDPLAEEDKKRAEEFIDKIAKAIENRNARWKRGDLVAKLIDHYWVNDRCWDDLSKNDFYKEALPKWDTAEVYGRVPPMYRSKLLKMLDINDFKAPKIETLEELLNEQGLNVEIMDRERNEEDFYKGVYAKIFVK